MSRTDRHQKVEDRDPKRAVGFAERPVLPGEDQEEFDAFRDELYLDYEPQGLAEEDAVETIAEAIWRKSHLGIFQRAFEARMKWGSFYHYPGDPHGDYRIAVEQHKRVIASAVELVTNFVKKLQANEVPGIDINQDGDIDKKITGFFSKGLIEDENSDAKEIAVEDIQTADICEISKKTFAACAEENAKSRRGRLTDPETASNFMKSFAEKLLVSGIENQTKARFAQGNSGQAQIEHLDAIQNANSACEKVFGRERWQEMWNLTCAETGEKALAKLGDLLTPERYIEEHRLLEVLDRTIDRSLKRLMDLQAAATKKTGSNINSLQPGWVKRKG